MTAFIAGHAHNLPGWLNHALLEAYQHSSVLIGREGGAADDITAQPRSDWPRGRDCDDITAQQYKDSLRYENKC